jgi:hypothetical protein
MPPGIVGIRCVLGEARKVPLCDPLDARLGQVLTQGLQRSDGLLEQAIRVTGRPRARRLRRVARQIDLLRQKTDRAVRTERISTACAASIRSALGGIQAALVAPAP